MRDQVEYLMCFLLYLLLHFSYFQDTYEHVGCGPIYSDTSDCRYIHSGGTKHYSSHHNVSLHSHVFGDNVPTVSETGELICQKCGINSSQTLQHSVFSSVLAPLRD